jgi:hypothetical protein
MGAIEQATDVPACVSVFISRSVNGPEARRNLNPQNSNHAARLLTAVTTEKVVPVPRPVPPNSDLEVVSSTWLL